MPVPFLWESQDFARIITGVVFHPLFWAVESILPVVPLVTYTQRGQFGLPPIIWYKGNLDSRLAYYFRTEASQGLPGGNMYNVLGTPYRAFPKLTSYHGE